MPRAESIAFVCPRFADGAAMGGAETLLRRLAEKAQESGRRVSFLTTCATDHFTWLNVLPAGSRRMGSLDVHFFPVDENRDIDSFLRIQNLISRKSRFTEEDEKTWIANSVNSAALCEHLRENGGRYDRIITGPYLFGLTYFASLVHPRKTLLLPCLHDEGFAYARLFKAMFNDVRGVLFNSVPERELAMRLYSLNEKQCAVVGMGLDDFNVSSEAFADARGIKSPYIIYSGRREPAKGLPLLFDYITAFRARTGRDVKLVITGTGHVDPPPELVPHLIDAGFLSEREKHEAMAGAAVFCHPSVNESLSIVVLESWLARVPVMVHANCAVTKYHCRKSNGGLWFAAYPHFEECLNLLLKNQKLREVMGAAGRDYVLREYSWQAVEPRLSAALDEI